MILNHLLFSDFHKAMRLFGSQRPRGNALSDGEDVFPPDTLGGQNRPFGGSRGEEEAAIGRFEDVTWYDYFLPEKETPDRAVLMRFKTDVIRCYAEDNFEAFLLSRGYRKKLDGREAFYKKDGEEVRIVFDDTRAEMILERRFSDGISRNTFAEIVPEQTLTAMKDFMSARE